ncbi:Hint domain-containing protein [Commensalibacter papalotli (ex Botero et al. 2024)]|uniref:Large exoprotein involved in heme utilization or adhesion (FhaB) (PDB:4RM6) n=1 Tax=Commensalibacter papalotli (ex Botero et al. 2024) TaxID=2972766 RepID=A0ABN8W9I3_9PROT|nr:Hint domain-containing protein [Commensalibacter papalotli (ex Botero et al. 2024)]CAI3930201.1 Large exoprotein involved in heme utilization or adhesion (FhaB) (PDB:4RM6) [Commensalibacter papalotli (ex Botero et al. 2024)]
MADWIWWQNRYIQGGVVARGRTLYNQNVKTGYGVTINGVANNIGTNYSAFLIINNGGISYNARINGGVLYVAAGGTTSNTVVNAPPDRLGHTVIEYVNGAKTYNTTILQGGQFIDGGGTTYNTLVTGNGLQTLSGGGAAYNTTVNGVNAVQDIKNNTYAYNTIINNGTQYLSGGVANNTSIFAGGTQLVNGYAHAAITIVNGGRVVVNGNNASTDRTYVANNGSLTLSGGYAINTTLDKSGFEFISAGGVDNNATLTGGYQSVSAGGTANYTTVSTGVQYVSASGVANNTNVLWGWGQQIQNGGLANNATIAAAGGQRVFTGGVARNTNVTGLQDISGGTAIVTTVQNGGKQRIYTGGTGSNATMNAGGTQEVYNGGIANAATVNNAGFQRVYTGGKTLNATVNTGGIQEVSAGGASFITVVNNGGFQRVFSGGAASNVTVNTGGTQDTSMGGVTYAATVNNGAWQHVYDTGIAYNTVVNNGGFLYNHNGGTTSYATLNGGTQAVSSAGVANNTTINQNGVMNISGGGIANSTRVNSGGLQAIAGTPNLFASAAGTQVFTGGQLTVYDWGRTGPVTLSGGTLNVSAGGGINGDVTFIPGAKLNVYSGAAVSTTVTNGGREFIYNGASAVNTVVNGGYQYLMNGGKINNASVVSQGSIYISGGTASGISVANGGNLSIFTGGIVNSTTINAQGIVIVNGGSISNNTITNGGILNINSGSIGATTISSGGALLLATDATTIIGLINLKTGGFLNGREALQDIVINVSARDNILTLLNDPKLFASTDSAPTITPDKNQSAPTINTEQDKSHSTSTTTDTNNSGNYNINDLNSLLNDPNYFAPASATPQASLLKTKSFIAPITFSSEISTYGAQPTANTDSDGNAITWESEQYTDGYYVDSLNVWSYTVTTTDSQYYAFVPLGGTEADRIYKIGLVGHVASFGAGYLPSGAGYYGANLIFPDTAASPGILTTGPGRITYADNYITGGVTLKVADSGSITGNTYLIDNSILNVSNGVVANVSVDSTSTATFTNSNNLTGTLTLEPGGKANITTETGGIISLTGTENKGLVISGKAAQGGTTVTSTINDFDGNDSITLKDIQRSEVASVKFNDNDHIIITLKDGSSITLNIPDVKTTGYALGENSDGNVILETCFLAGTAIASPNGLIAVETIKAGEIVETFDWKTNQTISSAVIWVGHKHMSVKKHLSDDLAGYPVRVLKNAISKNVPNKDLLITPEHCLFFDGNFIPARMLVNGRSIYYDRSITSYDYYHIETEQHSVIRANGMLTESYLDTGNRNIFSGGQKVVSLFNEVKNWNKDAAAPLTVHREVVEPIYNQINERALKMNTSLQSEPLALTTDPNLYLTTELGTIIQPHSCSNGKYVFNIPEGVNTVNLISNTHRPCETVGSFIDDRRELGVLIGGVFIINKNGIYEVNDHLSNSELAGWDVIEQSPCRWTKGEATLNIHTSYSENRILLINILAGGPYIKDTFSKELRKIAS